ncbi:hypothetical protein F4777DRAFT_558127 [Nemania sp. FL0916]|nr:hypothetical protein F4777DRAFT_558127 [Nemania sp. FL0916]
MGGQSTVYVFKNTTLKIRFCIHLPGDLSTHTTLQLEYEASIRRKINKAQLPLFQRLLSWDATSSNKLNMPYMAINWAEGASLKWTDSITAEEGDRKKILHAVAQSCMDLLRIQTEGCAAREFITKKIHRKIARARANSLPFGTLSECEDQKALIPKYFLPEFDNGPHVLVHGDLSANNIIVSQSWDVQRNASPQFATSFPAFLTHEPIATAGGGFDWKRYDTSQMCRDRDFYLQVVRARAIAEGGIVDNYYRILSRTDEANRYWWYTAAWRRDVHRAMVSCNWEPPIRLS